MGQYSTLLRPGVYLQMSAPSLAPGNPQSGRGALAGDHTPCFGLQGEPRVSQVCGRARPRRPGTAHTPVARLNPEQPTQTVREVGPGGNASSGPSGASEEGGCWVAGGLGLPASCKRRSRPPGRAQGSAVLGLGGLEALQGPPIIFLGTTTTTTTAPPPPSSPPLLGLCGPGLQAIVVQDSKHSSVASTFPVHKSSWREGKFEYLISLFE